MEEVDEGCLIYSGWVFLLVPSYPGSLRPKAVVCVCMSLGNVRTSLLYWLDSDWWFYSKRNVLTVALLKSNINATTHARSSIYLGWMDVTNLQQVVSYFCFSLTVQQDNRMGKWLVGPTYLTLVKVSAQHAPSSYRPIFNLDFISKILERLFLARIQPHITSSPSFNHTSQHIAATIPPKHPFFTL